MDNIQIYKTHHNYFKPYTVVINQDLVKIYKNSYDKNFKNYEKKFKPNLKGSFNKPKLLHILVPQKIFIGKSVKNKMTEYSGGHGDEFDGNSVLLQLYKNLYMFIGGFIKYLMIHEEVKEFHSPIGNNDVTYPWILTNKNEYILLYEDVCLSKPEMIEDKDFTLDIPHDHHYGINLEGREKIEFKSESIQNMVDDNIIHL
jgi:hypothetical protein